MGNDRDYRKQVGLNYNPMTTLTNKELTLDTKEHRQIKS